MLKQSRVVSLRLIIIYSLAFLIVREWLVPLPYITDTGNINTFIWFTLGCFILMYFRVKFYYSIPCILLMIVYAIHRIFVEGPFFFEGVTTAQTLMSHLFSEVATLIQANIASTSFEFRSFLFLLILAIASYLIHYWVRYAKRISFFLLATLIYITVLDTFTEYEADYAIVRFSVLGTILLLLLFKEKLERKEQVETKGFDFFSYNIGIICLTVAVLVGFYAPKYDPIWPDPVPTMRAVATGGQLRSQQKTIGYSDNDEQLGGGITLNDQLVFTAVTKESHYWRGESKEIYTGKGWISIDQVGAAE